MTEARSEAKSPWPMESFEGFGGAPPDAAPTPEREVFRLKADGTFVRGPHGHRWVTEVQPPGPAVNAYWWVQHGGDQGVIDPQFVFCAYPGCEERP